LCRFGHEAEIWSIFSQELNHFGDVHQPPKGDGIGRLEDICVYSFPYQNQLWAEYLGSCVSGGLTWFDTKLAGAAKYGVQGFAALGLAIFAEIFVRSHSVQSSVTARLIPSTSPASV